MSERGPIVCATDLGSTGARAVALAARVANATQRPLRLVHVTAGGPDATPPRTEAERVLRERLRTRVEAAAAGLERERLRAEGLGPHVEADLLEGRPWEQLLEHATRLQASMIVVGPHGSGGPLAATRGGITEHVLGTTADRIVRHAPCPVLVGPREGGGPERVHTGRWLVAVDGSPASEAALRLAHELGGRCEAELVPLHVVHDLSLGEGDPQDPLRLEEADGTTELVALVRAHHGPDAALRVAHGAPATVIAPAAAHRHAPKIVMGTRGRTGLAHLVLGGVAERTLRRSPVPVLIVRPDA